MQSTRQRSRTQNHLPIRAAGSERARQLVTKHTHALARRGTALSLSLSRSLSVFRLIPSRKRTKLSGCKNHVFSLTRSERIVAVPPIRKYFSSARGDLPSLLCCALARGWNLTKATRARHFGGTASLFWGRTLLRRKARNWAATTTWLEVLALRGHLSTAAASDVADSFVLRFGSFGCRRGERSAGAE